MSYQRELTTFKQGNQLSTCGEYNLQDLHEMFNQTEIDGTEEYTELEDILNEDNTVLSMSVTIMEQLDDDDMNMCIKKYEDEHNDDIVVPCSAELDNQMYNESI